MRKNILKGDGKFNFQAKTLSCHIEQSIFYVQTYFHIEGSLKLLVYRSIKTPKRYYKTQQKQGRLQPGKTDKDGKR